jgi:hypothetical protein
MESVRRSLTLKSHSHACASVVLIVGALTGFPAVAATYRYTGPNFIQYSGSYTAKDHLAATLRLSNPLPPSFCPGGGMVQQGCDVTGMPGFSLQMSDGVQTLETKGNQFQAQLGTDASGKIIYWNVNIQTNGSNDSSADQSYGGGLYADSANTPDEAAGVEGPGGTWELLLSSPASERSCDGLYNGTFTGALRVSSNQTCSFVDGAKVTGNVIVNGGRLFLDGASVTGNVEIKDGSVSIIGSTLGGNLDVQNLPPGSSAQICGSILRRKLQAQNNLGSVIVGNNDGKCAGNVLNKNVMLTSNQGQVRVYNNTAIQNLSCFGDPSISGGSNSAQRKLGQCSNF